MYNLLLKVSDNSQSQVSQISEFNDDVDSSASVALLNEFKRYKIAIGRKEDKSELEKYLSLNEPDAADSDDFDVLIWWKLNSHRYPTLALLARDVLAIPPSTVASESAFSTNGRVLDAYRSSLMPKMVQALICAQDWLRGPFYYLHDTENDLAELEKVDEGKYFIYIIISFLLFQLLICYCFISYIIVYVL